MVSPKFLRDHGVEVLKVVQHPREFIINFAGKSHCCLALLLGNATSDIQNLSDRPCCLFVQALTTQASTMAGTVLSR